ncbi:hypothetical protein L0F63_001271 [Massospora cicadina]|nr:hypothetical protein L0F63_001271 [Massospora cicadina]
MKAQLDQIHGMMDAKLFNSSLNWCTRGYDLTDVHLANLFLDGRCTYAAYTNHVKYRSEEVMAALLLPNSLIQVGVGWFRFIPLTNNAPFPITPPPTSSLSPDNLALVLLSSIFIALGRQLPNANQGQPNLYTSNVNLVAAFSPTFVPKEDPERKSAAEAPEQGSKGSGMAHSEGRSYPNRHPTLTTNPTFGRVSLGQPVPGAEVARPKGENSDVGYEPCSDLDLPPNPSPTLVEPEASAYSPTAPLNAAAPIHPTRFSDPATSAETRAPPSACSTPSFIPRPASTPTELEASRKPRGPEPVEGGSLTLNPVLRRVPKVNVGHASYPPYPPNRFVKKLNCHPSEPLQPGGTTNLVVTIPRPQGSGRYFSHSQQPIVRNTAVASDGDHSPHGGAPHGGAPDPSDEPHPAEPTDRPRQAPPIGLAAGTHPERVARKLRGPLQPSGLGRHPGRRPPASSWPPAEPWFAIEARDFPVGVSGQLADESERAFWDPLVEPVMPSLRPYFITTVLKLFRAQRKPGRPLDPRLGLGAGDGAGIVNEGAGEVAETLVGPSPRTAGAVARGLMELMAHYSGHNFAALERDVKVLLNQALWCLGAYQLSLGPAALKRFRSSYPSPTTAQLKRTHLKHCFYYSRLFAHMWGSKVPISRLANFDISPISIIKVLSASACHQVRRALDELDARF